MARKSRISRISVNLSGTSKLHPMYGFNFEIENRHKLRLITFLYWRILNIWILELNQWITPKTRLYKFASNSLRIWFWKFRFFFWNCVGGTQMRWFFILKIPNVLILLRRYFYSLTPQAQLSIQWTIRNSAKKKVLFVRLNQKEFNVLGAKFYQLSHGAHHLVLIKFY